MNIKTYNIDMRNLSFNNINNYIHNDLYKYKIPIIKIMQSEIIKLYNSTHENLEYKITYVKNNFIINVFINKYTYIKKYECD